MNVQAAAGTGPAGWPPTVHSRIEPRNDDSATIQYAKARPCLPILWKRAAITT